MSKYTTGEVAKLCGVTVRTVQYYDTRGILVPSELSEGGRRLYSEDDVKRMKVICYLRDLGLPIDSIRQLLAEEDPGSVISLLLDQQEAALKKEIGEPSMRPMERNSSSVALYIGCRTTPYRPVSITFWFSCTSTVLER